MEASQIKMFELFKGKFGDKEAEAFVHIINEKMDTKINQRTQLLATKDDIAVLRQTTKDDIHRLREDMSAMKIELRGDMSVLRFEFKEDMSKLRYELSRSIHLTTLGQLFAIIATVVSLVLLLLKK